MHVELLPHLLVRLLPNKTKRKDPIFLETFDKDTASSFRSLLPSFYHFFLLFELVEDQKNWEREREGCDLWEIRRVQLSGKHGAVEGDAASTMGIWWVINGTGACRRRWHIPGPMPNPSARVEQERMMSLWIRGTGPVAMDHTRRDVGHGKKRRPLIWPYMDSPVPRLPRSGRSSPMTYTISSGRC